MKRTNERKMIKKIVKLQTYIEACVCMVCKNNLINYSHNDPVGKLNYRYKIFFLYNKMFISKRRDMHFIKCSNISPPPNDIYLIYYVRNIKK